jgi:hypothetical protein
MSSAPTCIACNDSGDRRLRIDWLRRGRRAYRCGRTRLDQLRLHGRETWHETRYCILTRVGETSISSAGPSIIDASASLEFGNPATRNVFEALLCELLVAA